MWAERIVKDKHLEVHKLHQLLYLWTMLRGFNIKLTTKAGELGY